MFGFRKCKCHFVVCIYVLLGLTTGEHIPQNLWCFVRFRGSLRFLEASEILHPYRLRCISLTITKSPVKQDGIRMKLLSTNLKWRNLIGFYQRCLHHSSVAKVHEFPSFFSSPFGWSFHKPQGLQSKHDRGELIHPKCSPWQPLSFRWSFSLTLLGVFEVFVFFLHWLRSRPLQNMVKSGQRNSLGCPGVVGANEAEMFIEVFAISGIFSGTLWHACSTHRIHVCYVYLHVRRNQLNVGKHTIHGWYGVWAMGNISGWSMIWCIQEGKYMGGRHHLRLKLSKFQ